MKLTITGGAGFIGRNLYELIGAVAPEISVSILDLVPPNFALRKGDVFYQGDIRDASKANQSLDGTDALIHLAAAHKDQGVSFEEFFDVNVSGTRSLLAACTRNSVHRILFTSSVAVYGAEYADDETQPNPVLPYGQSKLKAEGEIRTWVESASSQNKALILRPSVVIGRYNVANMYNLISVIREGKLRFYIDGGKAIKSLVSVDELSAFILNYIHILDSIPVNCETLNFVSYPNMSTRETINIICDELGKSSPRFNIPFFPFYAGGRIFDLISSVLHIKTPINSARIKKLNTQTLFEAKKKEKYWEVLKEKLVPIGCFIEPAGGGSGSQLGKSQRALRKMVQWLKEVDFQV